MTELLHLESARNLAEVAPIDDTVPNEEARGNLVGDVTRLYSFHPLKVEAIVLITGLDGTGSDPAPSQQRQMLLSEMQTHEVDRPGRVLASPNTSLAMVRGFIPPGAQEGDRIDIEIRIPRRSETTSLRGGWLMRARMKELRVAQGSLHSGHVLALGEGAIVVDALIDGAGDVRETRGRIVGGGIVQQSRKIGLVLGGEYRSVSGSATISSLINARFHTYDRGSSVGVAKPMRDNYIELHIHPRYRNNISRYVRVIQSIALGDARRDQGKRLARLREQLLVAETSATAALHLEAIGVDGQNVLLEGLQSENAEVRFYSAEALAFQNQSVAASELQKAAQEESAFRWNALTALGAMDDFAAKDALVSLLDESSAESRFGAFRALHDANAGDPLVRGERLRRMTMLHLIPSEAPPLVHVSRMHQPEIIIFGDSPSLHLPLIVPNIGGLMVKSTDDGRIRVSRFTSADNEDQQLVCSPRLDDLIRTLSEMGAEYPELIQLIVEAHEKNLFDARLVFDAIPTRGRTYHRESESLDSGDDLPLFAPLPLDLERTEERGGVME